MRRIIYISILGAIILFSSACEKENMGDCFKSTGSTVRESRSITQFTSLELDDRINLFLTFSEELSIEVEAGKNLQSLIKTEVKNGVLSIKNDNRCNWVRSYKREINVYLTTPLINNFTYRGSGEVRFMNTLQSDIFRLNMWEASGDLHLDLDCKEVELKSHTGPADIYCRGISKQLVAYTNGLGRLELGNLISKEVLAVNVNSGKLRIHSDSVLNANIEGKGNIYYTGNPSIQLRDNGQGTLIKED